MEKELAVSILEDTYLKSKSEEERKLPEKWDELSTDEKMHLLDVAISTGGTIDIVEDEEERMESYGSKKM